jgi:MtfA peptidase
MDFTITPELAWFVGVVGGAAFVLAAAALAARRWRAARRRRLYGTPFDADQLRTLEDNVPLYRRLPGNLQARLRGHMQVFMGEKRFEGCGGLEVTETMRFVVAAHACLLQLGRKRADYYPSLTSILLYPHTYEVPPHGRLWHVQREAREGESWHRGEVVLAWREAMATARDDEDGRNNILHEFAHQLDQHEGLSTGTPQVRYAEPFQEWVEVLHRRYDEHVQAVEEGHETLLNAYGATNLAEFFAVSTEVFFERPVSMKAVLPDLYRQLARYYDLDPGRWI